MKFWIAGFMVVLFLAAAGWLHTIAFPKSKPCVPFAQREVPNENDGNWKKISSDREGDDGGLIRTRVSYEHKKAKGLKLSVYHYFDQLAFKAWACRTNNENGDVPDHMIAVMKNGEWHPAYAQAPKFDGKTDENGNVSEVTITLLDKDGKIVVERTFNRPN